MVETCEKQTNEGETDTVYQHVEDGSDGEGVDDVEVGNKNTSADPTLNSFNSQIANMRTRSGSLSKWDQLRLRNLQEKKDLWMKEMEKHPMWYQELEELKQKKVTKRKINTKQLPLRKSARLQHDTVINLDESEARQDFEAEEVLDLEADEVLDLEAEDALDLVA